MRVLVLVLALTLAGCNTTITSSHYDQTCTAASDCVAVGTGDVCRSCLCPNSAINQKDLARYEADEKRLHSLCPGSVALCDCVQTAPVTCTGGRCALGAL